MSDLYEVEVADRIEADLEVALADAVVHGMSPEAVRRICPQSAQLAQLER